MSERQPLRAGVVGVGSMGKNHARVYGDLDGVSLVGVADADEERAATVAESLGTESLSTGALFDRADLVSIAVPTEYHYDLARQAIETDVGVLVEKPFVADPSNGRDLVERADERGVTLQVGHVERFNPVVEVVEDVVEDLDVIAAHTDRLTPPPDRDITDTAVMDLMIHDIDLVQTLLDGDVATCGAFGTGDGRYAVGTLKFDTGVVCNLTASRVTQESVRRITVSAASCRVKADLLDQRVEIHRASPPEVADDVDCSGEDVVEQLTVADGEPLARELRSFADAVRTRAEPRVTGEDGLRVLEVARAIERESERDGQPPDPTEPTPT